MPARSTAIDSIRKSRYLIDELPEFRTRSFNAVSSCHPLGEVPDATGKYTSCDPRKRGAVRHHRII
jgi:hypothetical protein